MKSASATRRIIETLGEQHPNADTELHYRNPFRLLVARSVGAVHGTTLNMSARVVPGLSERARARKRGTDELEKLILPPGSYARSQGVKRMSKRWGLAWGDVGR